MYGSCELLKEQVRFFVFVFVKGGIIFRRKKKKGKKGKKRKTWPRLAPTTKVFFLFYNPFFGGKLLSFFFIFKRR